MAKVIKVKGDATDVQTDFNHAPVGLYTAKAAEVSERESSNTGQPMVEIRWDITKNGDGKKLKESYAGVFYYAPLDLTDGDMSPGWARRLKEVLVAFGLPMKGANLAKIEGKEALLRLREDTDQDGEYRPRVGKILPLGSKNGAKDEDEEEEESEEPEAEGEDEGEYTWEELQTFDRKELRTIVKEEELDIKVTAKLKDDDLREKIAEALEIDMEEEEEDEEEEADLESMSRAELKAYIAENELDVKILRKDKEADIIEKIEAAEAEDEEEEDEDEGEDEEEGDNYDSLSVGELKAELEGRDLATAGKKAQLIARLRKDDEEEPV